MHLRTFDLQVHTTFLWSCGMLECSTCLYNPVTCPVLFIDQVH